LKEQKETMKTEMDKKAHKKLREFNLPIQRGIVPWK